MAAEWRRIVLPACADRTEDGFNQVLRCLQAQNELCEAVLPKSSLVGLFGPGLSGVCRVAVSGRIIVEVLPRKCEGAGCTCVEPEGL
eukprot:scaffold1658_cov115-Isochrysis_galbana.AAC.19